MEGTKLFEIGTNGLSLLACAQERQHAPAMLDGAGADGGSAKWQYALAFGAAARVQRLARRYRMDAAKRQNVALTGAGGLCRVHTANVSAGCDRSGQTDQLTN